MLRSSFTARRKTLTRWVRRPPLLSCACAAPTLELAGGMSRLLLAQNELRGDEVDDKEDREHEQVEPELAEAQPLGEGADADRLVPGRRKAQAGQPPGTGKGGYRHQQAREIDGRNDRQDGGGEHRRHLGAREGRNKLPEARRCRHIE